ncbi:MAG TPA: MBL fold metallo-hydrolase, partial [Patescibacteria group bacterium]|nr:MBL fold metallo-hydrolase [Patescibacteria group bacterium]
AAHEVTGSCSLVETEGMKILVDCGMFQGSDFNEGKNLDPLPFDPKELKAVLVTHAHLDHVGRLPLLTKGGYTGHFYATAPTIELAELIMEDALSVMEYDNRKFGRPILYSHEDIAGVVDQFKAVEYGEPMRIARDPLLVSPSAEEEKHQPSPSQRRGQGEISSVAITFHDAGHIFGSAFIAIEGDGKKVVFSGDMGNVEVPILRDTEMLPDNVDVVVCESTYGDRIHESTQERQEIIEEHDIEAIKRGGVLMIPSFSLERTQELIYELNDLIDRKHRLPRVPIFLDSPLAIGALRVYRKYHDYYDGEAHELYKNGDDLFQFPGLTMCETREESKKINMIPGPKIIIAGAGMMNGGRILHHALRYLSDERSTLLIVGYQAQGTLGRKILNGESPVNVMGERVQVRCHVKAIGALSAHGDQNKLLDWLGGGKTVPKKVYLNHGEPEASEALAKRLTNDLGIKATVVNAGLKVEV